MTQVYATNVEPQTARLAAVSEIRQRSFDTA
jgi:hypothetical protein